MLWLVLNLRGENNHEFTLDRHLALIMMIRVWRETNKRNLLCRKFAP